VKKVKLGQVLSIYNGSTPSKHDDKNYDGDIPWITPKDLSIQKNKYISRGERNITKKGLLSIGNKLLPQNTILFSSRAPIGLISISLNEVSTNQGFKNLVCDEEKINPEYLYYLLKTRIKNIQRLGSKTTFQEVSKKILENFEIYIEENVIKQQKIASVLSILDSKIELNDKINTELEAIAKLIYDYWFVQFDFPDQNGKPYKSSGGKMVWSEELKREIPEEWKVENILKIVDWIGGSQPPKSTFKYELHDNYVRFIQNRDYANNQNITYIPVSESNKLCDEFDIMMDKYGEAGKTRFGLEGA